MAPSTPLAAPITAKPGAAPAHPPLRLAAAGAPGAGVLPATGVVLIGTRQTIEGLRAQVEGLERSPVLAGCILVGAPRGDAAGQRGPSAAWPVGAQVPVLGGAGDLPALNARYHFRFALVCIPAAMADALAGVRSTLDTLGIPYRVIPALGDLLAAPASDDPASSVRALSVRPAPAARPAPLDLAALVGRKPYALDHAAVERVLAGKRILITGAGGSIGSELARVAARLRPELLILMERSENALFDIDRQLAERFPGVPRKAILHDVVDADGTLRHLVSLRPHAVFHAAAHKHVPLMEDHPGHAVTNNLFGTKAIADAAVAVGAERFVMISTDKAVNPVSVMGASKRLAEMYVRSLGFQSRSTRLSMVRFGNVLGSACSVLTIWTAQLAEGGPITVTDPRMTRYFMTIPEAATLVIQSSTVPPADGGGGEGGAPVYVLDMGEPVRILDLACRFLRAHGLEPRIRWETLADPSLRCDDIAADDAAAGTGPTMDIVFTGARPGEKLHEELAYAAEQLRPTGAPGINAWAGPAPEGPDATWTAAGLEMIADLSAVRASSDRAAVLAAMRRYIPELPSSVSA